MKGSKLPNINNLRKSEPHSYMQISEITGGKTRLRLSNANRTVAMREDLFH